MYRYYVDVTDRIYVLPAGSPDEDYLCRRLGAVRITRPEALRLASVCAHTVGACAWCQPRETTPAGDGSGGSVFDGIRTAATATAELIRFYRKVDSLGVTLT